jgi:CRP/FNR family cyclic AMP-dependent transcriptional regulator
MLVQSLGYLASLLVFCTFYMRTMLPLRCLAIASNLAFISYGIPLRLWPVVILHALLLPLNVIRLFQIRRMLHRFRAAPSGALDVGPLISAMTRERHLKGTVLFRKGSPGESAYYVAQGEVEFPELGAHAAGGEIFGEIGVFSPGHVRTASAVCASDVELYRINADAVVVAFHQSPVFAFSLVRIMVARMIENMERGAAAARSERP